MFHAGSCLPSDADAGGCSHVSGSASGLRPIVSAAVRG
jgi:hypothetical protein